MADTFTNTVELKILVGFVDEDDRTLTLPNPKSNITTQELENLQTLAAPVLIGDKYGAQFSRFKSVVKKYTTRTKYDIS